MLPENEEEYPNDIDDMSLNDNAADDRKMKRRRQKIQSAEKQEAEFWRQAMSSEVGRRSIWKLLIQANCFEQRFACGPNGFPQTEATWFQAGEQSFGLRLYHMLARNDRILLLKMHDENDPYYSIKLSPKDNQ
jgi:hypothetical protein